MFGQTHHFLRAAPEPVPYAIERYSKETRRLYGVLNSHLAGREFLGSEYSVADIATYPWVARYDWHKVDLNDFPGSEKLVRPDRKQVRGAGRHERSTSAEVAVSRRRELKTSALLPIYDLWRGRSVPKAPHERTYPGKSRQVPHHSPARPGCDQRRVSRARSFREPRRRYQGRTQPVSRRHGSAPALPQGVPERSRVGRQSCSTRTFSPSTMRSAIQICPTS